MRSPLLLILPPLPPRSPFATLLADVAHDSIEVLPDGAAIARRLLSHDVSAALDTEEGADFERDGFGELCDAIIAASDSLPDFSDPGRSWQGAWKDWVKALGNATGRSKKRLFHPLRVAMTGEYSGTEISTQMHMLRLAEAEGIPHVPMADRIATLAVVSKRPHPGPAPPKAPVPADAGTLALKKFVAEEIPDTMPFEQGCRTRNYWCVDA